MSWNDERVEALKTMWGEGKSASQIAKELGGVTRNAVIGKVHRLGLSNRATATTAKSTEAKAKAAPKAKPAPKAEAAPKPAEARPANIPARKPIITAGQPLPPQPSPNGPEQLIHTVWRSCQDLPLANGPPDPDRDPAWTARDQRRHLDR